MEEESQTIWIESSLILMETYGSTTSASQLATASIIKQISPIRFLMQQSMLVSLNTSIKCRAKIVLKFLVSIQMQI